MVEVLKKYFHSKLINYSTKLEIESEKRPDDQVDNPKTKIVRYIHPYKLFILGKIVNRYAVC